MQGFQVLYDVYFYLNLLTLFTLNMSEGDVLDIKFRFLELFADLDETQLDVVENWILSRAYRKGFYSNISIIMFT